MAVSERASGAGAGRGGASTAGARGGAGPGRGAVRFTWQQVCARRLARHGLGAPDEAATATHRVGAICGAHAQVLSAAELSVALRVVGATRSDVRAALWEEHALVKTFGPRGTVHVLASDDLPMWTGALSAIPSGGSGQAPDVRLSVEQTDAVVAAIGEALSDAELNVEELGEQVVARTGAWAGDLVMPAFQTMWPRWRQATHAAAHRGVLCFGPNRGRTVTYTNPHRWRPRFAPRSADVALAELVERWLLAYGPATPQQFARWLAAPPGWAAGLFERLGDALEPVTVEGERSWVAASDTEVPAAERAWIVAGDTEVPDAAPDGVRLLPYFDAYVVGCHPRERVFPGAAAKRALAGGQAGNFPVLLVDGVAAGVWHQRRSGRRIHVTVEPLRRLPAARRSELEEQVERIAEILEATPRLRVGTVSVGPHA